MKVSILVAVKEPNDFLKECIDKCKGLLYKNYEIIVLPDRDFLCSAPNIKIIATGPCLPAKKRDIGSKHASGEILAFLDDDAYPSPDWLDKAARNFQDPEVAAVGGPAVTPPGESFLRRASGLVYESLAVSGQFRYRYLRMKRRLIDDYPSSNLFVRSDVFNKLGGFKIKFWPGEDTHLCLEITRHLKKKIVYDPEVLVFHHRRPLFLSHLNQIKNYGLHRGYFAKRFPQTSLKWGYFIPSLFVMWLIAGLFLSIVYPALVFFYLAMLFFYAAFAIFGAYQNTNFKMTLYVFLGTFMTHLCYGIYFLLGLLKPTLSEEERP